MIKIEVFLLATFSSRGKRQQVYIGEPLAMYNEEELCGSCTDLWVTGLILPVEISTAGHKRHTYLCTQYI